MLEHFDWITREMLQADPDILFVFGDNLTRRGLGGQAKEMRGEPNAVGIPTKISAGKLETDYFTNNDYERWLAASAIDITRLLLHKGSIIWPRQNIGAGRAELQERAPRIWEAIQRIHEVLILSSQHSLR